MPPFNMLRKRSHQVMNLSAFADGIHHHWARFGHRAPGWVHRDHLRETSPRVVGGLRKADLLSRLLCVLAAC